MQPDRVAHVHRVERAAYRKADLCVFSKPTASRPHIHVTHMLAARTLLTSAGISRTGAWNAVFWELRCEESPALTFSTELNLGLQLFCVTGKSGRPAQLFVIFPFTHKVLQKYRQVNGNLHSEKKAIWMVQKPSNTRVRSLSKLLTLPCTQRLSAEPSVLPPLPNQHLTAQWWVDDSHTWEAGHFLGVYVFDGWTWSYQVYLLINYSQATKHCAKTMRGYPACLW